MTQSILFCIDGRTDLSRAVMAALSEKALNDNEIILGDHRAQIFSDKEICVDFQTSVRGKRVYILSSPNSSDEIMKLMLAIDAAKRAAASEIIPILPYFPYARQDKKDQSRGPIGAKVIANMLESNGATSVITFDLHADQIQGFFEIPVIHMEGKYIFAPYIVKQGNRDTILCSPDAGGVKRVKAMRDWINEKYKVNLPFVMIDKTRKEANIVDEMIVIGDVKGKDVFIIDDMCDTGGTLAKAAETLLEQGAFSVRAIVTHGVLSGKGYENILKSKLKEFVCSDTLNIKASTIIDGESVYTHSKIGVISIANQIAWAILAVNKNSSVEQLKKMTS